MESGYKCPSSEPIAIVGSSCRFAGGVTSPSKLWDLLAHPTDLSKEVPPERFNTEAFHHPDGEYHGTTDSTKGYFLEQDHRVFDSAFFNITPKEAEAIDPQQRLVLEVVYEALESAGYTLEQYAGEKVGVYAGVMTADYDTLSQRDELMASQYYATGNARSIVSNRVSYFFNFNGPSMTIDTACSSSLVALHQAILSMRSGETVMACVTGVNLMITPEQFIVESSMHMLSPSGHCRMWDTAADGYARGEGVAAIFLKPLSKALRDGDHIQGIVRESGVNSDGRTKGITMPNPEAQAALIKDTYHRSNLDPLAPGDRCQYFEAHGTGTQAGDPREAAAINEAFFGSKQSLQGPESPSTPSPAPSPPVPGDGGDHQKLLVGSVKTVIGHTEGAAGLAGVLKVVQAMRHSAVPPNLHLEKLNPSVKSFYSHLCVPTGPEPTPWPMPLRGQPLRASVNSFGFGGTNAHAIIERYDPDIHNAVGALFTASFVLSPVLAQWESREARKSMTIPLLFSANSQKTLVAVLESHRAYLRRHPATMIPELAWQLYSRRTAHTFRLAIAANSWFEAVPKLDAIIAQAKAVASPDIGHRYRRSATAGGAKPKILGIFTGQGAQWATMSRRLLSTSAVYCGTIMALDSVLASCHDPPTWSLEQMITGSSPEGPNVNVAAISQPLCTAVQIALVDLLHSIGVTFSCVVGHSSGEIAAAYAAGRLTARDAILVSYYRGMYAHLGHGEEDAPGGMVAVGLTKDEAAELCLDERFRGRICPAASNSSSSVTLSGDRDAVEEVQEIVTASGKFARLLAVDTAYHSHHMDIPAAAYLGSLEECQITPMEPSGGDGAVWVSSVYENGETPSSELLCGPYWQDNMVRPVLFRDALEHALRQFGPLDCALEIGPHPALKSPASQTMKEVLGSALPYSCPLDRKKDDGIAFAEFLGFMWTHFGPSSVNIRRLVECSATPRLAISPPMENLPAYPWDHSHIHYRESRVSRQYHFRSAPPHELLGVRTRDDTEFELRWRNILHLDRVPWIEHHKFQGQALLPASAYCVMAFDAARVLLNGREASVVDLENLEFMNGITIEPESPGVEILFALNVDSPREGHGARQSTITGTFTLCSAVADGVSPMRKNFAGELRITLGDPMGSGFPGQPHKVPETLGVNTDAFYDMMTGLGLSYTGPFRALRSIKRRYNFASAKLSRFQKDDTTKLSISPATLDACLQSCFSTFSSAGDKALWTTFLPVMIRRVRFNMGLCDHERNEVVSNDELEVHAHLTGFHSITKESAARITGDICIYDSYPLHVRRCGDVAILVEGLTVGSFASTRPADDYELYLTTQMQVDPEDQMVPSPLAGRARYPWRALIESCEMVAGSFPHRLDHRFERDALSAFISNSPYRVALSFISSVKEEIPELVAGMLPTVIREAEELLGFHRYLAGLARQLAHKYPRMNVLELTDPEVGLTEHILHGLQKAFSSYTVSSPTGEHLPSWLADVDAMPSAKKVHKLDPLDFDQDLDQQLPSSPPPYDLVVLSTSLVQNGRAARVLKQLKELMRPGGFLFLVHMSKSPMKDRLARCIGVRREGGNSPPPTPPEWPDILDECDFYSLSKSCRAKSLPAGYSLIVRQSESPEKRALRNPPVALVSAAKAAERVLVIGDRERYQKLRAILGPACRRILHVHSLRDLSTEEAAQCTSVIMVSNLDEEVLSRMTQEALDALKAIMRPGMVVLWATQFAHQDNADAASSFGFARTMLAEVPSLTLQMMDVSGWDTSRTEYCVASAFSRLVLAHEMRVTNGFKASSSSKEAFLWTHEPELWLSKEGDILTPRVLPYKAANDRVNACRRVVTARINTLEFIVGISAAYTGRDYSLKFETTLYDGLPVLQYEKHPPRRQRVEVHYSSIHLVNFGDMCPGQRIIVGRKESCGSRDVSHGETVVAMARAHESVIEVPSTHLYSLGSHERVGPYFINIVTRALVCLAMTACYREYKHFVLVGCDMLLLQIAKRVTEKTTTTVQGCVAIYGGPGPSQDYWYSQASGFDLTIPRRPTSRDVTHLFHPEGTVVFDFLPAGHAAVEAIGDALPWNCTYVPHRDLLNPVNRFGVSEAEDELQRKRDWDWKAAEDLFRKAVEIAWEFRGVKELVYETGLHSLPALLHGSSLPDPFPLFQAVDWRAERVISHTVKPRDECMTLRHDRTYVLVGITRDFGQSLSSLLAEQGACHIVLASRNPKPDPIWAKELKTRGLAVHIMTLDVTSLHAVKEFRAQIEKTMPPVGGVVNGAMVLDDRVFSQMTVETFRRVMEPKTVGSENLDKVFCDEDMDFFIMTSSFAAIGGHAGQSNYAAANMYMNCLAERRRKRGMCASVLNIGVIYGLGLLHREKDELYESLARDGYPPISERDLHHMFLEAMEAGSPRRAYRVHTVPPNVITTGLSRYRVGDPNPQHWHRDPRFSHFTVDDDQDREGAESGDEEGKQSLSEMLSAEGLTAEDMQAILVPAFTRRLEGLLGAPAESIVGDNSISELGVDSLVAVEIRSWIWRSVSKDVPVMKILASTSIAKLCADIADLLIADKNPPRAEDEPETETAAESSQSSDPEAEAAAAATANSPSPIGGSASEEAEAEAEVEQEEAGESTNNSPVESGNWTSAAAEAEAQEAEEEWPGTETAAWTGPVAW